MNPPGSLLLLLVASLALGTAARGQGLRDWADAPADNYSQSAYRMWTPDAAPLRGVLVLLPGMNGDGRGMASDPFWQQLAGDLHLALLAGSIRSTGPHDTPYYLAEAGSGRSLLDGLAALAAAGGHPELSAAPVALWGASAGGEFAYNFACWKPERVLAFVAVKGGYYDAVPDRRSRAVPGLWFIGERDAAFRGHAITALVLNNRPQGALWAFALDKDAGHEIGATRDLAARYLRSVVPLRLPSGAEIPAMPAPLREETGWQGNPQTRDISPASPAASASASTVWLPDEQTARAWKEHAGDAKAFLPH